MLIKFIGEKVKELYNPIEDIIYTHELSDEDKFKRIIEVINDIILNK